MRESRCRGCPAYVAARATREEYLACIYMTYGISDKCPCIECLVKVMCRLSCHKRQKIYIDMRRRQGVDVEQGRVRYIK